MTTIIARANGFSRSIPRSVFCTTLPTTTFLFGDCALRLGFEMEAKNKVKIEDSTTESPTSVLEDEMDFFMLITTYGKLGDFNGAEKVLGLMNKNGYAPNVVSQTALMEAYGKGGRYNNAEAIFRRMQKWGLEPSAFTYQIILKTFVHGNKFREAEELFDNLLNDENSPLKPD
ncbi:hypothetical protein JHK82_013954 [Glycine max]|nr:hypothetical protein JHK82_013954 [Glycine max]